MVFPSVILGAVIAFMHRSHHAWAQDATYYAYTELYFDEAKQLLVGSPADDCVRVWVNDRLVHDNKGLAQWSFNRGFLL
jgi:hypothetical protein